LQESSIIVTFTGTGAGIGIDVAVEDYVRIELDSATNEGKTSFDVGEKAYLLVYYVSAYQSILSGGTLNTEATKIPVEIEDEYVTFAGTSEEYLSYLPVEGVTYSWVGNDAGAPSFSGRKVILPEESVAVLKCSYTTLGDRISILFDEEGQVVIVVTEGDSKANITVDFVGADEDEVEDGVVPIAYRLKVTDYCSGSIISEATVTITTTGAAITGEILQGGSTDADGEVYLGMLIPGRRYDLQISSDGYLDSELDQLNNDYFVA
jgi:hypothetical protein